MVRPLKAVIDMQSLARPLGRYTLIAVPHLSSPCHTFKASFLYSLATPRYTRRFTSHCNSISNSTSTRNQVTMSYPQPQQYGPPQGGQYPPPQQGMNYQQGPPPPPPESEKSRGCLTACLATLCCCWLCGETCSCCLDCLSCCDCDCD
ncbi:Cysteine-rich transmembrane CYSTM domain [Pyrenophora seminiperda CCB06]|uniref:Cysteine-rich transmembrane CYSTM domain n=1 Tax=Pyrenophora seminiperda CCB06 TaxID=1302712 RepID=A0A3M7LYZ0_9PLEO|nr:Cysteine-rich transmembrane CYSTM domain [Pyrenophora seminiperda CCB06]